MADAKKGEGTRFGGLLRRRRERGRSAHLRRVGRSIRESEQEPEPDAGLAYPVRARPRSIHFIEEYHYNVKVERYPIFDKQPTKTLGEIQITLPCDRMGDEAIADGRRHTARVPGAIPVRYGWLALAHMERSDLPQRLRAVRSWERPPFQAFPLIFPLIEETHERLEEVIEAGTVGWEQLYYQPAPTMPFPFGFDMWLARDSAVPTEPLPADPPEEYRLPAPNGSSGMEWALHVRFSFNLARSAGVSEEESSLSIGRMHINWPVPVVASELRLLDAPGGRLSVDERYKQVVVEGVPVRFTSSGTGTLTGEVSFRIGIRHPAPLQGKRRFKGRARVDIGNLLLSRVQAQYLDAAGYLQNENCDGNPLISYRTELHIDFEYWWQRDRKAVPRLLERRYSWLPVEPLPEPFVEVEQVLQERGFTFDEARGMHVPGKGQRWWATRELNGQPLILDVVIEQQEHAEEVAAAFSQTTIDSAMVPRQPLSRLLDLSIRGYYGGRWEEAARQVAWLEERLRQRLGLRHEER